MLRFLSFLSGSFGNCYLLEEEGHCILIDAGVSLRSMKKVLEAEGLDRDCYNAVLVTHDHNDHIRNLNTYCKRQPRPVWATPELFRAPKMRCDHIQECRNVLSPGWNPVDGFSVRYFVVPHDATQTVGYAICSPSGHRFVLITDSGRMTGEALNFASQADTVVIESNYDMDMLMSGPYTHDLKMRICQGHGHLSNDECADAIRRFYHPGLRNLFLCHLSENNNTPQKAYDCALEALGSIGVEKGAVNLRALPRRAPSPMIVL
ncbi:MAG: MBL fold metallo-hydrolase [Candidatus Cryptobacteroides sp.]